MKFVGNGESWEDLKHGENLLGGSVAEAGGFRDRCLHPGERCKLK